MVSITGIDKWRSEMNKQNIELGWQPIETAPKEGIFLVTGGTMNDELYSNGNPYHVALVNTESNSIVESYTEKQETYYEVINTCYYSVWISNPTHWSPIPTLPNTGNNIRL